MSTTHVIAYDRRVVTEQTMHIINCWNCSIQFGIGDHFMKMRRQDERVFYCPNGHGNYYQETEKAKLEKELAHQKRVAENERQYAKWERDQRRTAERQRAAARGQVTKIKNRVGKGVCPCCNRTFQNLGKHMAGQHPEWATPHE